MEIAEKDLKASITSMIKEVKETIHGDIKERYNDTAYQIGNIDKDRKKLTGNFGVEN